MKAHAHVIHFEKDRDRRCTESEIQQARGYSRKWDRKRLLTGESRQPDKVIIL